MSAYYVGLKLGTNSVSWCVTSPDYRLIRRKGKDLWGVRLFDEGNTAQDRRMYRISRRRTERRKLRRGYVRQIFADAIHAIDPGFYVRLDESFLKASDKSVRDKNSLFADAGFSDADFYAKYPTISHLRSELIHSKEPHDVRLVYLAVMHIFEHRGHFFNKGLSSVGEGANTFYNMYADMVYAVKEGTGIELLETMETDSLQSILMQAVPKKQKAVDVAEFLGVSGKDKQANEIVKLLVGLSGKLSVIFGKENLPESLETTSISFEKDNSAVLSELSDEQASVLDAVQRVHDSALLSGMIGGHQYLSDARVAMYEMHGRQLKKLKNLYKKYAPERYSQMFRAMRDNNYSAYVRSTAYGTKKYRRSAKVKEPKAFYDAVRADLKKMPEDDQDVRDLLEQIELENFLPKQMTGLNRIIPNQLHTAELKAILANAEAYLPFLKERDESGLTASERLLSMFTFCVPYYVGTLKNGWAVRKEDGYIYPWNIDKKLDLDQTAADFIRRMVGHCTYLTDEEALPDSSLLYEKFKVLSELNPVRVNGNRISSALKQDIYRDLFMRGKAVSLKQLAKYLEQKGVIQKADTSLITGTNGDFKNVLRSYGRFAAILGTDIDTPEGEAMAENIIFWGTVYPDDKRLFIRKVREVYGSVLTEEQVLQIGRMKFGAWGKLSKSFLLLKGQPVGSADDSLRCSLIDAMWDDQYTLMELLGSDFTYSRALYKLYYPETKRLRDLRHRELDAYYLSGPVKRVIWQAVSVMKEIESVMGCPPERIFIGTTGNGSTLDSRTDSRKKWLLKLYAKLGAKGNELKKELEHYNEIQLRQKKLFLYFLQQGRSMYTGKRILLSDLFNTDKYDIDHIYPRRFVRDDSLFNNLVLVEKAENKDKDCEYPLSSTIQKRCLSFWGALRENGFITQEKFLRLTRTEPFSDNELAGFIGRQNVDSGQGAKAKAMTSILRNAYRDADVVCVKAAVVNSFRNEVLKQTRVTVVNDLYLAADAYLTAVVGNVYHVRFTADPLKFIRAYRKDPKKNRYHMYRIFEYDVVRNGAVAWRCPAKDGTGGTIDTVRQVMSKSTPLVTMMSFEWRGQLMDQTLYPASKAGSGISYMPIKSSGPVSNMGSYGGYGRVKTAYFSLVEYVKKEKKVIQIVSVPLTVASKIKTIDELSAYFRQQLAVSELVVHIPKIKRKAVIQYDGYRYYITGRTGNYILLANAEQLLLPAEWMDYIHQIEKYLINAGTMDAGREEAGSGAPRTSVTKTCNEAFYDFLTQKHTVTRMGRKLGAIGAVLAESRDVFCGLSVVDQCKTLMNIIRVSGHTAAGTDLSLLGRAKSTGISRAQSNISGHDVYLINPSVTGIFESVVRLS